MERCPSCGAEARPGAKFCTTCGYRFVDADAATTAVADVADDASAGEETETPSAVERNGWPSTPDVAATEQSGNWPAQPVAATEGAAEATAEVTATDWSAFVPNPWPTAPQDAEPGPDHSPTQEGFEATNTLEEEVIADDAAPPSAEIAQAKARAVGLLDELRATIDTLGGGPAPDLSGVISDLEVALTPPGALQPDDLAQLREALHTARQRPRDIDTVVDLTRRVDALGALMIAYDRAIAAIERSLDVLRHEDGG